MIFSAEVLEKAIAHYGIDAQLDQVSEECLELALAIRKYKRQPCDGTKWNMMDEIADVIIMAAQASIIVGVEAVEERMMFKLNRLEERIKNG